MTNETNVPPSIERVDEISSAMRSAGGPHYDGPILISSSECRDILAALRDYVRLRQREASQREVDYHNNAVYQHSKERP